MQKLDDSDFQLTCSVNTFLFGICRNLSLEHFRKKGKEVNILLGDNEDIREHVNVEGSIERETQLSALDRILQSVGQKCLEILTLYYHQGLRMKVIAERMGFKSETSAKTQKYKCIEKARELSVDTLKNIQGELI